MEYHSNFRSGLHWPPRATGVGLFDLLLARKDYWGTFAKFCGYERGRFLLRDVRVVLFVLFREPFSCRWVNVMRQLFVDPNLLHFFPVHVSVRKDGADWGLVHFVASSVTSKALPAITTGVGLWPHAIIGSEVLEAGVTGRFLRLFFQAPKSGPRVVSACESANGCCFCFSCNSSQSSTFRPAGEDRGSCPGFGDGAPTLDSRFFCYLAGRNGHGENNEQREKKPDGHTNQDLLVQAGFGLFVRKVFF